ncbi:glycosyltransferase family 2 protein [Pelagibacterales bacterium SAG-MED05]|nr:glycosyltransferase family 2 protein [Pelagibacterales bacterium SAG-MED05]
MENKKTEIDIILPNYNSWEFIDKTIQSVLKQNFKNWRLIIVDDFSDIKTRKKIKKYEKLQKVKIYWLKKNKGPAYCRNFAISKSKSNYIAFIDSDDIWEKNKLRLQVQYMKKNNYDFTYTYYKTFGLKFKKVVPPNKFNFDNFIKNTSIATSTMIIKRQTVKNIKFTDTAICEDYYFKCKILKKIKFAYCLKNYLTKYRIREDSLQSNKLRNFYWIWKINYKYNKLNFFQNLKSLFNISLNSVKKYGLK